MLASLAPKAEVEVDRCPGKLPLRDHLLNLCSDQLERWFQRLVEQRSAVGAGAPNPPGYESVW